MEDGEGDSDDVGGVKRKWFPLVLWRHNNCGRATLFHRSSASLTTFVNFSHFPLFHLFSCLFVCLFLPSHHVLRFLCLETATMSNEKRLKPNVSRPFDWLTCHPPLTVMLTVDHLSAIEHHGDVDHLGLVEHLGGAEIIVGRVTTFQRARTSSEGPTSASGQQSTLDVYVFEQN